MLKIIKRLFAKKPDNNNDGPENGYRHKPIRLKKNKKFPCPEKPSNIIEDLYNGPELMERENDEK